MIRLALPGLLASALAAPVQADPAATANATGVALAEVVDPSKLAAVAPGPVAASPTSFVAHGGAMVSFLVIAQPHQTGPFRSPSPAEESPTTFDRAGNARISLGGSGSGAVAASEDVVLAFY